VDAEALGSGECRPGSGERKSWNAYHLASRNCSLDPDSSSMPLFVSLGRITWVSF